MPVPGLRTVSRKATLLAVVAAVGLATAAAAPSAGPGVSDPVLPAVSPDGSKLGWVEGATSRILVAKPDGTEAHALGPSFKSGGIGEIAWTPAGIVIDSNFRIFLLSEAGRLTNIGPAGDLGFSVGGGRVASGSASCGSCVGPLTVVDLRSKRVTRLGSPKQANTEPAMSPDGRQVAWAGPGGLWVATVSGNSRRLLAANGSCPQWSPDGRSIAFLSYPSDSLRVIPATGARSRALTTRAGGCNVPGAPTWSPDSTRIAFEPGSGLAIVDARTGHLIRGARSLGRIAGGFAWTADGSGLYASVRPAADEAAHDNCTALWLLDATHLSGTRLLDGCP